MQEQYRHLSAYLQAVREEERKSLAREIHDELGQALTSIKLDLALLRDEILHDVPAANKRIDSMTETIHTTIASVKQIMAKLRPGILDDLGLTAAIEWQAKDFQDHTGIACEVLIDPEDLTVDPDLSTAIFRIFQETLTNAARHAAATRVSACLTKTGNILELQVRDNGKGITREQAKHPKSFGLIGIRERAQYWNGSVDINGTPRGGTTVTVRFPWPERPA